MKKIVIVLSLIFSVNALAGGFGANALKGLNTPSKVPTFGSTDGGVDPREVGHLSCGTGCSLNLNSCSAGCAADKGGPNDPSRGPCTCNCTCKNGSTPAAKYD